MITKKNVPEMEKTAEPYYGIGPTTKVPKEESHHQNLLPPPAGHLEIAMVLSLAEHQPFLQREFLQKSECLLKSFSVKSIERSSRKRPAATGLSSAQHRAVFYYRTEGSTTTCLPLVEVGDHTNNKALL